MMYELNGLYFKLGIDYSQDICLEFNIWHKHNPH